MRYFVYKDAQILGPFERERLDEAGGLRPETLVCAEGAAGRRDTDWQCLEQVAELAGVAVLPPEALGVVDNPVEAGSSALERFELETLGIPAIDESEPEWMRGLFNDAEFKQRWGLLTSPEPAVDALTVAQDKVSELTKQLAELNARIATLESDQTRLLRGEPAPASPPSSPLALSPAAAPPDLIPQAETPPPPVFAPVAQPEAAPPAQPAPEEPEPRFALRRSDGAAVASAGSLSIRFGATRTFKSAAAGLPEDDTPPASQTDKEAPSVSEFPELSLVSLSQPDASAAPKPDPAPQLVPPPEMGTVTPSPLQPPMTMRFSAQPLAEPPSAAVAPAPEPAPIAPAPASPPIQAQDVLARLARPAPAGDTAPPKRRSNSKLLIVLAAMALGLCGLAFVFLRNSRDLKTMVNMGGDQKPIGMEVEEKTSGTPSAIAPNPAPVAQAPTIVAPPAVIADGSAEAISLVKEYPLDGDRGTVAQWLQYSFTANPGDGNKEEWTAGAVDATTYLVHYRVLPGPHSPIKDPISYVFEADGARKTVLGKNPAARGLMAGLPAKPEPKAKKKIAPRIRGSKPKTKSIAPNHVPLAPLPSDTDLLPPSDNDSGFRNDTVNPPL